MPAKKKSAVKKSTAKKASASEAKNSVSPKTAAKKAPKKSATKKAAKGTGAAASGSESSPKKTASELLKRTQHNTPSIFKVGSRKHAPVLFTLEDVREILKNQKAEEVEAPRKTGAAKKEAVKAEAPPAKVEETPAQKSKHGAASLADILGFGSGPAKPAAAASTAEGQKIPAKHKPYYGLLLELRNHVQTSLGMHAEDTLKRSQKEDSGDISTSADAGTDNFDRDFALSVVSSEQEALREIEAAIKRIHNGTYGTCEITGEQISAERLEAVPFTRFSLEGQRQYETTARRRVQRGGGSFLGESGGEISFGDDDGDN